MREKIDDLQVRQVLDEILNSMGDHLDRRPVGGITPKYIDCGAPSCLVAEILVRLGVSVGVLRALDKEGVELDSSEHPIRRRFTKTAWSLLCFLQKKNDGRYTWGSAIRSAYRVDSYWIKVNPKFAYPGPWCTAENAMEK